MFKADDQDVVYKVVLNQEEQYSIWPADREVPAGWREEGTECLAQIEKVWIDMRPLSLRRRLAATSSITDS